MREYGHIETVRWFLDETVVAMDGELPSKFLSIPTPHDYYHIYILRVTTRLLNYIYSTSQECSEIFESEVLSENNADGYALDISMPIKLSPGIVKTAILIEEAEEKLQQYQQQLTVFSEKASFDNNGILEDLARRRLSLLDKLIDRTRLFHHAHLWLHWTSESLDQAAQIRTLIEEHGRFEEAGEDAYAFFAFPPLIVATLSCTAMIEEVGAKYINQFTSDSVNTDKTSSSRVLNLLDKYYADIDDFDIESVYSIIDARNEIAHYMTTRKNVVEIDLFQQYADGVAQSIFLVRNLVLEFMFDILNDFPGFIEGVDNSKAN